MRRYQEKKILQEELLFHQMSPAQLAISVPCPSFAGKHTTKELGFQTQGNF